MTSLRLRLLVLPLVALAASACGNSSGSKPLEVSELAAAGSHGVQRSHL